MDNENDSNGETEQISFDYWYDLEDDDKEVYWHEFSYNRFQKTERWEIEPTDWELFLQDD